ncbi:zeta toxin family protein [Paenibacillus taichungensis]|uniref:zeta toxin family protein n=1 Tax=Paenibacillus taichungensis TaxID=484184 RepID=UPI0035DCBC99
MLRKWTTPESSPSMIVFAGTNGAGKSQLTNILKHQHPDVKIIDADAIAKTMSHLPQRQADFAAGREAVKQVRDSIKTGTDFSIETTLGGQNVLRQMEMAKSAGFNINLYYVGLDNVNLHIDRVAQRVAQGGHHIAEEDIRRRYTTSLENLPKAMRLADRTLIFDNSEVYKVQAEVYRGQTRFQSEDMSPWVKTAMKNWTQSLDDIRKDLQKDNDLLSKELQKTRQALTEVEKPLRILDNIDRLETKLQHMNKVEDGLKPKSLLERITQPNKKELQDLSAKRAEINSEINLLREKSPSPERLQTIGSEVRSLSSMVKNLDNAVKESSKQITAVSNDILKRDMQQTYSKLPQQAQQMSQSMQL